MTNAAQALAGRTLQNETDIEVLTALRLAGSGSGSATGIILAAVLAADESTAADTNPISLTDLAWDVEAGATYAFRWIGNVSPATATTGCGFQLLVT